MSRTMLGVAIWFALAGLCVASPANYYATQASGGVENSATASNTTAILTSFHACNYDASNAKVAMLFDASVLPANGAVPILQIPLATSGAVTPTCGDFSLPATGIRAAGGIVVACSTTGKTLTVDTGTKCWFFVGR